MDIYSQLETVTRGMNWLSQSSSWVFEHCEYILMLPAYAVFDI